MRVRPIRPFADENRKGTSSQEDPLITSMIADTTCKGVKTETEGAKPVGQKNMPPLSAIHFRSHFTERSISVFSEVPGTCSPSSRFND
jgi:hypothetical protein